MAGFGNARQDVAAGAAGVTGAGAGACEVVDVVETSGV